MTIGYASYRLNWTSDQTQNLRNSLSPQSLQTLVNISAPIEVTAFSSNSPFKGRYFRKSISALIQRYQQHKTNISLRFIDPSKEPQLTLEYGVNQEGEMIIQLHGRSARMQLPYTEEAFTNILLKLMHGQEQHIIFSEGHGEPDIEDTKAEGYATFAQTLSKHGFQSKQTATLPNIGSSPILVIHGAKTDFSPTEVRQVSEYIQNGGDLIWLIENAQLRGLASIANYLNIDVSAGVALDNSNAQYGMDPRTVSASLYAKHAILEDFNLHTFFTMPHRVSSKQQTNGWQASPLIGAAENGWLTAKPVKINRTSPPRFDDGDNLRGPINIAMAIERTLKDKRQRIIIVGDSDFLSNREIDQGSNQQLGLRMVQWVSDHYPRVSIQPKLTKDSVVVLPQNQFHHYLILLIFNGFQFVVPLLLLAIGFKTWRTRQAK